ncbi:hypothetical protein, partial [Pedobacter sp.]
MKWKYFFVASFGRGTRRNLQDNSSAYRFLSAFEMTANRKQKVFITKSGATENSITEKVFPKTNKIFL